MSRANDTTDDVEPVAHAVSASAATSNLAPITGLIGYRVRPLEDFQLGVDLFGGVRRRSYIGGYEARDGGEFGGLFVMQGTMLREGPLALDLRGAIGARHIQGDDDRLAVDRATSVLAELGVVAYVATNDWLTLRIGWNSPFALAVDPAVDLETTGFLLVGGAAFALGEGVALTADGNIGGLFGFNGDGAKLSAGGQLGIRWTFEANTRSWRNY